MHFDIKEMGLLVTPPPIGLVVESRVNETNQL